MLLKLKFILQENKFISLTSHKEVLLSPVSWQKNQLLITDYATEMYQRLTVNQAIRHRQIDDELK